MEAPFIRRHPLLKDVFSLLCFVLCVVIGTMFVNNFIFRSYNVLGPSMESTLYTNDRLIVNRIPVTIASLKNERYTPKRGEIIVFKNPHYSPSGDDEYLVKRVIAFENERVLVKNGKITVFNKDNPNGFNPDDFNDRKSTLMTAGDSDITVTPGTIYVAGDHRNGSYSYDSRNGLGLIPLYDIIGPVKIRMYPITKIRLF